jgi:hypothetical protein
MKNWIALIFLIAAIQGCKKNKQNGSGSASCNMLEVQAENATKITVSDGVYGTVSFTEGNCMPAIGGPENSICKTCPVKRTVKIYEYTTVNQATPRGSYSTFYDSFNTKLIKEVDTDSNGFFQTDLRAGQYTFVVVEKGRLYAGGWDEQGGIRPFTHTSGSQNVSIDINYKAAY